MKERPILFNGQMVRAILEGRKTQTRRVCSPQPFLQPGKYRYGGKMDGEHVLELLEDGKPTEKYIPCPKPPYCPGDRLWVRETFSEHPEQAIVAYRADGEEFEDADGWLWEPKWTPSIHMPRAASRITLEVTDVRAERVQDISEEDALAEGIFKSIREEDGLLLGTDARFENERLLVCAEVVKVFRRDWEDIYGQGSWESNPWVWVICFKVLEVKK